MGWSSEDGIGVEEKGVTLSELGTEFYIFLVI